MSSPEEQILNAIAIANDHYGPNRDNCSQAIDFLATVRAESAQSWRPALSLFVATNPEDANDRQFGHEVRIFCLSVIAEFLDMRNSKGHLAPEDFATLKEQFLTYLKSEYLYGRAESSAPFIRNKFSQVLTLLFLATYESQWPDFFSDMFALLNPPPDTNIPPLNIHIAIFFFKLVQEISAEVADQLLKNARAFSAERMARDGRVRDLVRERDAQEINTAVLAIVLDAKAKLDQLRATSGTVQGEPTEELVDLGIRAFASYVPWIDINLTVTPETVPLLFSLISDPSFPIRLATTRALTKIVNKGLKVPSDKLKLIQVLSLGPVIDQLESQTAAEVAALPGYSENLTSFREALAHLSNALGLELVTLCSNTTLPPDEIQAAAELLIEFMPTALRFLADKFDDISTGVFPLISEILQTYKKAKQASPQTHMTGEKRAFLETTLGILIDKLKWDEDDEPDEMDQDDQMMFENMRKDVRKTIDTIYTLDNDLVTEAVSQRAQSALDAYEAGTELPWETAELAIYLVFMYGELGGKDKGKGRLAFCMAPPGIPKEQRKAVDYSEYPLTPQGEMMQTLVRSRISTYPHPTVAMQFFETATRYADFFKVRKENVLPALEAFLDNRGIHHPSSSVRKRVFYLFFRFVQALRIDIDIQHVPSILQAIQDLLTFDTELPPDMELPELSSDAINQEFLANVLKELSTFDAQLYMFEAAGALISTLWSLPEHQSNALQSVTGPLLSRLSACLQVPIPAPGAQMGEDHFKNVLAVHHCIQALGCIPKGFPEYPSPVPPEYVPPPLAEFRQMADAILVSLDITGRFRIVREAARFSFGRIIFAAGPSITEYIPRLMSSLLVHFEATEFVEFIGFISHMAHKLQAQFTTVLEDLFAPLTKHVSSVISKPITGTDDKVARVDTKKAFLAFLSTIMSSNLGPILVSQNNVANLEAFLETVLQMAADPSDTLNQKLALSFISKFLLTFGHASPSTDGAATNGSIIVPGIELFIYQRIIVVAFSIPFVPEFNVKDAQSLATLQEIANLLQTIVKVRGDEALTYISTVFLPSQNVPAATAIELTNSIRSLDKRGFQKYLTDFVKASRPS